MGYQRFVARERFEYEDGTVVWRPGGGFDCLGYWAKVQKCLIRGTHKRVTAYATGYAGSARSVPACTRVRGQYIGGYFTMDNGLPCFVPYDRFLPRLAPELLIARLMKGDTP